MDNVTDATLIRKAARGQGGCGQAIGTHPQREAGVEQVGSPSEQCLRGESVSPWAGQEAPSAWAPVALPGRLCPSHTRT